LDRAQWNIGVTVGDAVAAPVNRSTAETVIIEMSRVE
jgi:hypothetical protein